MSCRPKGFCIRTMAAVGSSETGTRPTSLLDTKDPGAWWEKQGEFSCVPLKSTSTWDPRTRRGAKPKECVRLAFISDTHGMHGKIEPESIPMDTDILVHCGDLTNVGEPDQIASFVDWAAALPCKPEAVVVIAGNHDISLDKNGFDDRKKRFMPRVMWGKVSVADTEQLLRSEAAKRARIHYLNNESVTVMGYKFFGSPESAFFFDWAFNLGRGEPAKALYRTIPDDTDILLTHGPPVGHGDETSRGMLTGDVNLLKEIEGRVRPLISAFGHIHEGYGVTASGPLSGAEGVTSEEARVGPGRVTYINASTCTLGYVPSQPPIVVDLPRREKAAGGGTEVEAAGGEGDEGQSTAGAAGGAGVGSGVGESSGSLSKGARL